MLSTVTTFVPVTRARPWLHIALSLGAAVMLTGCMGTRDVTGSVPNDIRQRHPITLQEGDQSMEIFVGAKRGGLTPLQRAEVLAFARNWQRQATGGIIIDMPAGTANEASAREAHREIRSILSAAGAARGAIIERPYRPAHPNQLAPIRLNYPRVTAQAGPCGLWPDDLGPSANAKHFENRQYHNFGCASQRNLAAMVEEPADLVQPRASTPIYTARRTMVLEKYRQGQDPAAVYSNSRGRISEIGQ
ncbi:MAG TPA: CpaD family pilus assembly protein [Xanthobacteraceae bacterium]|nr:CpaD family pilus assembly protein [Xanthobacteraceae bacterium]